MTPTNETRREFIRRTAYTVPVILTLPAAPAYAKSGSEKERQKDHPKNK